LGYQAELMTMARQNPSFTYQSIISRPAEEPVPWGGPAGYVQDLWKGDHLERVWGSRPEPDATRVFLCGNPSMIEDMVKILGGEGFREHSRKEPGHVFVERYW
jgi:ferredoxin--NADP+ reductase